MARPLVQRRPAETTTLAAAVAAYAAARLGVDDADTVALLALLVGAVPSLVTWLVDQRRQRGLARRLE